MIENVVALKIETSEKSASFLQVKDGRGRIIPNLYRRNDRFYIQVHLSGKGSRRFPLVDEEAQPVKTVTQAQEAMVVFKQQKREGVLPLKRSGVPLFESYYLEYCTYLETTNAKDPKTIKKEKGHLKLWAEFFGSTRLADITLNDVRKYALERSKEGKSPRTVNLDVIALSNLLNFAKKAGLVRTVVTDSFEALKWKAPKRELFSFDDLDKLVAEALRVADDKPAYLNGRMLADWLLLMAFTGARRQAALTAKWSCVDWANQQITFHTKFDKHVTVDFNPKLEAHLKDMETRRNQNVDWMFEARYEIENGPGHLTNMEKTLTKVREAAGFPNFFPHLLRHAFISYAVMQGVPYMTIAAWVGHSDGGVLIGRCYGHLNPAHKREQANKLVLSDQTAPTASGTIIDLSKLTAADLLALLQKVAAQPKTS